MKRLIFPALLGLALAGCSSSQNEASTAAPTQTVATEAPAASFPPIPATEPDVTPVAAVATATPAGQPARNVIYQGELDLAVVDFNQATTSINHLLEQNGAYLGTAHETRADGQHRQEMTIKVPPAHFVALVTALAQLGQVENKDIASADVTADLLQTDKRVSDKQALAAKYRQQLARATSKEETSRLQAQASQLQADLSADQTHLQQFASRSQWATLLLRYHQPLAATDTDEPQPAFTPQFQVAFNRGWSVVMSIAVVLTNIWPLLLLSGLGAWGWRRWQLRTQVPVK
jgi:hypothetical protein